MIGFLYFVTAANAAIVTEIDYVTQITYEDVEVYVDSNGTPWTTVTSPGQAPSSSATSVASSHSHAPDYVYITTEDAQTSATPTTSSAAPSVVTTYVTANAETAASSETPSVIVSSYVSTYVAPVTYADPTTSTYASSSSSSPDWISSSTYEAATSTYEASTTTDEAPTSSTNAAPTTSTYETATTSAYVAPTTSPYVATTTPAASKSSAAATSTSSSGTFSGDATYYEVGLGACGVTNTDSDYIAALNSEQWEEFGSMSNGNPVCGKTATLSYGGKSVTVTIEDKCPGCSYGDLDLSPAAFEQLASESLGRIAITWSFD